MLEQTFYYLRYLPVLDLPVLANAGFTGKIKLNDISSYFDVLRSERSYSVAAVFIRIYLAAWSYETA